MKVKGRKRHLLVNTQGLVLMAKVHNANVTDREGIKLLLEPAVGTALHKRLTHLWLDAGYTGQDRGAGWVEGGAGMDGRDRIRHPPKPAPEEVMMRWAREWAKEGVAVDAKSFMPQKGPRPFLPKRWKVERTFSWLGQNRRMSLWITREVVCERGSVRVRCYDSPHDEAARPCLRAFHTASPRTPVNWGGYA